MNVAASARDRLRNLARENGVVFDVLLVRYVHERLLYRLSVSPHASRFVLKGAMLFAAWTAEAARPTRDLDLLGYGDPDLDAMAQTFRDILAVDVPDDGVVFDLASLVVAPIREEQAYPGVRASLAASLAGARVKAQVDVGFGDVVTPEPVVLDYPSLLDHPAPRLATYPKETVVAEKLEAVVSLGLANTRMKDFYDLLVLSRSFDFEGPVIAAAITATFERRRTELPPDVPVGLTDAFAADETKARQWRAFVERQSPPLDHGALTNVVAEVRGFLWPVLVAARLERADPATWTAGGPWISP